MGEGCPRALARAATYACIKRMETASTRPQMDRSPRSAIPRLPMSGGSKSGIDKIWFVKGLPRTAGPCPSGRKGHSKRLRRPTTIAWPTAVAPPERESGGISTQLHSERRLTGIMESLAQGGRENVRHIGDRPPLSFFVCLCDVF